MADTSDFEVVSGSDSDFEVVTPQQSPWQRPPREGLLGAAINRVIRGGKMAADAIYPPAPAPPKPWGQFAKDTAAGIGLGAMEIAGAPFAPIGEAVRPIGEALGRAAQPGPEQQNRNIEEARNALQRAIAANDPLWIESAKAYLANLEGQASKPPEQIAYETGQTAGLGAEMLAGAMFPGKGVIKGTSGEAPFTASLPRGMRRQVPPFMERPPAPLTEAQQPRVDMGALRKAPEPPPAPSVLVDQPVTISELNAMTPQEAARRGWFKGAEGSFQKFEPKSPRTMEQPANILKAEPELPRPTVPPVSDFEILPRAAARQAPERPTILQPNQAPVEPTLPTAAEIAGARPEPVQGPQRQLVNPQGRPVRAEPERVPGAPEPTPAPVEAPPRPLRRAGQVAEERTGGEVKIKPKVTEADFASRVREEALSAERELEQGLSQGVETDADRIMRHGISGGSGAEDVGWVTPEGKEVSHLGKPAPGSKFEMTHSEAITALHGQEDIGAGLANGYVRYVKAGNHLNVETGLSGIDNAIAYISRNGRSARGGVVLELTDPSGGMIESQMFDRPWQAIEYLKSKKPPETLPTPTRTIRPIEGGAGESPHDLISRMAGEFQGVDPKTNTIHFAEPESGIPLEVKLGANEDDVYNALQNARKQAGLKPTPKPEMQIEGVAEQTALPPRTIRSISGGAGEPMAEPLVGAGEVAQRRLRKMDIAEKAEPQTPTTTSPVTPVEASTTKTPTTPKEFGSAEKTVLKTQLPETAEVIGSKRAPRNEAGWKEWIKGKLPQEEFVRRERPASPVITEMEGHHAELSWKMNEVIKHKWASAVKKMDPAELKRLEAEAVAKFDAGASLEEATRNWPEDLKAYIQHRNDALAEEQLARKNLGLDPIPELPGPYLPRITNNEMSGIIDIPGGTSSPVLQTTVKGAQEHRKVRTMLEGEKAGLEYVDPRNAILIREWNGMKLVGTEKLVRNLRNRALFETEAAAKAVSPTGEAFQLTGVPGKDIYWVPTKSEAIFLRQNLTHQPTGLMLPGIGGLKNYADTLFRNPNLINPAPHVIKNMAMKYMLARGPKGLVDLPVDMAEFVRGSNPKLLAEFKEYMPYADADPAYAQLRRQLIESGPIQAAKKAEEILALLNKGSAKVVFKWGDPSMRYSLFKRYRAEGLGPQEAANHAWIDLVRYATRSDLTDFWKSIPLNFFVPWRVGTYTSVLKQLTTHPIRAALTIGGIDLAREIRYRETGQWTHLPWDYVMGPIAMLLEEPSKTPREAVTTAMFGPHGETTAQNIARLFEPSAAKGLDIKKRTDDLMKILWGISQFSDTAKQFNEFQKDGNIGHIVNMLTSALFSERQTEGRQPKRLMKFIPEEILPKARAVRGRELARPQH